MADENYDDDIIEITPQEPVVTEILDDEECETKDEQTEENDDKNGSFGGESDVEIQEPHIPITDLDDIEDIPNDESNIDDSSQYALVKIKEEPKDDDFEEEDAFEDVVGTMVPDNDIPINPVDEYVPEVIAHIPSIASIDGNVDQTESSAPSQTTNKIRINITHTNRPQTTVTHNENSRDSEEGGETGNSDSNKDETMGTEEPEEEIEFDFKTELKGIAFNKVDTVKNGYETSGLCSIM